jgi:hypothetical protein
MVGPSEGEPTVRLRWSVFTAGEQWSWDALPGPYVPVERSKPFYNKSVGSGGAGVQHRDLTLKPLPFGAAPPALYPLVDVVSFELEVYPGVKRPPQTPVGPFPQETKPDPKDPSPITVPPAETNPR